MKIAKLRPTLKAGLLQASALVMLLPALPALAQQPVTVPPANAPAMAPAPVAAAPTAPAQAPATTVAADPLAQPAMPSAVPVEAMPVAANSVPAAPAAMAQGSSPMAMPATAAPVMAPALGAAAMATPGAVTAPPANMPQGTPSVVTQVMQNLKSSEKNISVEDMSKAEDALARLDLLLQIEKKVGEIKKAQDDRDTSGPGMSPGAAINQVPASALVLPNQGMGAPGMGGAMNAGMPGAMGGSIIRSAPASGSNNYEIEQISGTNGSYSAVLTTPDGDRKTVRAGDKLDGRLVKSVSLDGVELGGGKGKKNKMLTIKNDGVLLSPTVRD